jgi:hypothetical protein
MRIATHAFSVPTDPSYQRGNRTTQAPLPPTSKVRFDSTTLAIAGVSAGVGIGVGCVLGWLLS